MKNEKKGLAVIYDPHNLYQFIWYYCNAGRDMVWDALCLPNDKKGEYMHTYCEKSELFDKIYKYDDGFKSADLKEKYGIFFKMLVHFIIGKKKAYCRKLIQQYVNWDNYERVVVLTGVGLVSGACIALSGEKDIVIMEDGTADYRNRRKWISWRNMNSFYHWQGFILARMGYCCPAWYYFKPEKSCIKYSTRPDRMNQDLYKEIRQLYSCEGTDTNLLERTITKTYPRIADLSFEKIQAVFLTIPLSDFVIDVEHYRKRIQNYLKGKYDAILLKRHPRDTMEYDFGENTVVYEVDSSIPAEAVMPYLKHMDVYMCEFCSTVMYAKPYGLHCIVLVLDGYYEESLKSSVEVKAPSEEEVKVYVTEFGGTDCEIRKI